MQGLAVIAGPGSGTRRLIDEEEIRIGKAPGNHLCLPDPTVSRFHCVIEQTPRGLLLRDLGSFNGTQVGGCWVESAYLSPQVPIQLGNTILQMFVAEMDGPGPDPRALGPRILGTSPAIQSIVSVLPRLALSQATVLLEGETGTGKSMIAELIHRMGPRSSGPFVVVDCGALAPSLIESELFGHERGAFTGASDRRLGAFEAAQGGTVFLDEIGELPLELQPKLLRAIEDRTVRRLGSATPGAARRAGGGRHQPRPAPGGGPGRLPRRPLLPPGGGLPAGAAAARAARGHPPAGRALLPPHARRHPRRRCSSG